MTEQIFIYLITPILASFLTWFFARRKYNAEVKTTEIQAKRDAVDMYKDLADDLYTKLEKANDKITQLEALVSSLQKELRKLKKD